MTVEHEVLVFSLCIHCVELSASRDTLPWQIRMTSFNLLLVVVHIREEYETKRTS